MQLGTVFAGTQLKEADQGKPMRAEKQDEARSTKPDEESGVQPNADEDETRPETDASRTGKGSGASGGGSFGNLPGKPVTGGSPQFGPREIGSPKPDADEAPGNRHDDET